jgi:Uma2 family endonuclease
VNSPKNPMEEIIDRIDEYFFHGVELVWVIIPRHRTVYVYKSSEDLCVLTDKRDLEGANVLPGFRLPLTQLFDSSAKPTTR